MIDYPTGCQFKVPTWDQLKATGWKEDQDGYLRHPSIQLNRVTDLMITLHAGKILAVKERCPSHGAEWYRTVEETEFCWPVEACEIATGFLRVFPEPLSPEPKKCDCGALKARTGHAYWCSTQKKS